MAAGRADGRDTPLGEGFPKPHPCSGPVRRNPSGPAVIDRDKGRTRDRSRSHAGSGRSPCAPGAVHTCAMLARTAPPLRGAVSPSDRPLARPRKAAPRCFCAMTIGEESDVAQPLGRRCSFRVNTCFRLSVTSATRLVSSFPAGKRWRAHHRCILDCCHLRIEATHGRELALTSEVPDARRTGLGGSTGACDNCVRPERGRGQDHHRD